MEKVPVIFHCDCNNFFASVELLEHPELQELPVAVCGDPEGRHGIVLAKNEAAKAYGIQTAETIWQAKKKCPGLRLLPPHRDRYRHFSKIINEIYQKYTDRVEPFGIDESWMDVTCTWAIFEKSPKALADRLRREVQAATGLTISVGVSFTKVLAKLGSDYKKPNATTVFGPGDWQERVYPLPVGNLLYVGKAAQKQLALLGITTIGQLAQADPAMLEHSLGKLGADLSRSARGQDTDPVRLVGDRDPVKSVGNGLTFRKNLTTAQEIRSGLWALCDQVATRLRKHGLWAGAVQLTIKDANLKTIQRQMQLPFSTQLSKELVKYSWELLQAHWRVGVPIRMLTVTALNLSDQPFACQTSLFEDAPQPDQKRASLEKSLDAIRAKYGKRSIGMGSRLGNDLGLEGLEMDLEEQED